MVTREEATTVNMVDGKSVEELALDAESAIRDGLQTGDSVVIEGGLGGSVEILDAGHSWVYDVRNYQRSKVNNNMLRTQLTKLDTDVTSSHYGKRVFTTENLWNKGLMPAKGTFKCFLHKDAPERAKWDTMGYAVCPAGSLASPSNQESHAKRTHKAEWAAIETEKEQQRLDRRDQLDSLNLQALLRQQEAVVTAPAGVTQPTEETQAPEEPVAPWTASSGWCPKCESTSGAPKAKSRSALYYAHKKKHA